MQVHLNALQADEVVEGELSLTELKKFIAFCRTYVFTSLIATLVELLYCFLPAGGVGHGFLLRQLTSYETAMS